MEQTQQMGFNPIQLAQIAEVMKQQQKTQAGSTIPFFPAFIEWEKRRSIINERKETTEVKYHYLMELVGKFLDEMKGNRQGIMITDITPIVCEDLLAWLKQRQHENATIVDLFNSLLKPFFETQINYEIIDKNPAKLVKLPKMDNQHKRPAATIEECKALAKAAMSYYYGRISIAILAETGLRRCELLGLKWDAVDLKNKCLHIVRSLVVCDGKPLLQDGTKTKAGIRIVPISPELAAELKMYRDTVQRGKKDFVISQKNANKSVHPDVFRKAFNTWKKKAGVRKEITPHSLRHTFITLAVQKNINPLIIMNCVGHKDQRMLNRYTDHSMLLPQMTECQNEIANIVRA